MVLVIVARGVCIGLFCRSIPALPSWRLKAGWAQGPESGAVGGGLGIFVHSRDRSLRKGSQGSPIRPIGLFGLNSWEDLAQLV